jgi:tight adherence protein B
MSLFLSLVFIATAIFLLTQPVYLAVSRRIAGFEAGVEQTLAELFIFDTKPRTVTYMVVALSAFCVLILGLAFKSLIAACFGLAIGLGIPYIVIWQMTKRRRHKLELQLMDGLITLANGTRAGLNLGQAIKLVEDHGKPPLSQEFGLLLREIEHGAAIDVALDRAGKRIKIHNFRLLFAALKTTRKRGGNIPETLDRLGDSIREIVRLEEKVKALTAEGRMQAYLMSLMPFIVMGIYGIIDLNGLKLLFNNGWGQTVLALVVLLDFVGFMWMRKIVAFEI